MSNFLLFIKNYFSVFSVLSLLIIIISIYELITIDLSQIRHINPRFIYYLGIVLALLILIFDFIIKKCIYSRLKLNLFQFFILLIISLFFYYKFYQLCQD